VSAAAGPGNARKVLTGAAIVVTTIAIIVVAILLVRGPGAADVPPATTVSEAQELAKLKAEALEAGATFFQRRDRAVASGDVRQLDDIYVPGSKLAEGVRHDMRANLERGEVIEARTRPEQPEVISVTRSNAEVRLTSVVLGGARKDAKTGKVLETYGGGQRTWRIYLVHANGKWLVENVLPEDIAAQGNS
jgi:hypothetical protein